MLGFYPIADAPLASLGQVNVELTLASQTINTTLNSVSLSTGQTVPLSSQTLNFSQNSVLISDDDVIEVAGQVLTLTLNGVTLSAGADATLASQTLTFTENSVAVEVQPPTFDSQYLAFTLNSVALSTGVNAFVAAQNLTFTENSVALSTNNYIDLTAEPPLYFTLNSVSLSVGQTIVLTSQALNLAENSVSLITDQTIVAASQTIYTELNSLRMWGIIPTDQPGNCPDHCDGTWAEIAYDELVYGDDFAIATEPLCALPQALPPIRKFPGSAWDNVPAQTTTTWTNIPT
jgi:hypothetical protein